MNTQHTPGPWVVDENGLHVYGDDSTDVCTMGRRVVNDARGQANARLIAAAPELLEALRQVQEALANYRDNHPGREDVLIGPDGLALVLEEVKYVIVDPAIAKATGEQVSS